MTLEDAADDLVAKLGALDEDIREAGAALAGLSELVARVREEVAAGWDALEAKARALLDALDDEQQTVEKEADEAEKALRTVESALKTEQEELAGTVAGADGSLKAMAEHVAGLDPRLVTAAEEVETAARDLVTASESAEAQWEKAFAQSQEQQQAITEMLQQMASDLVRETDEACQSLEEDVTPPMTGSQGHWETALEDLKAAVESHLETLQAAYATQGQAAAAGSVEKAVEIVGGIVRTGAEFDKYLDAMRDAMREAVETQGRDVETTTHEHIAELVANVNDVAALLGTYEARLGALGFIP
ncbi:MAG TPA: hypothetical protein VFQ51_09030 [Vicinamibacteria bacterium]|nr:hypothetical protein [Vicinamibacteria bacterium]